MTAVASPRTRSRRRTQRVVLPTPPEGMDQRKLARLVRGLRATTGRQRKQIEELEGWNAGLTSQISTLRRERDSAQTTLDGTHNDLVIAQTARDSARSAAATFESERDDLRRERDRLRSELAARMAELHGLREEHRTLRTNIRVERRDLARASAVTKVLECCMRTSVLAQHLGVPVDVPVDGLDRMIADASLKAAVADRAFSDAVASMSSTLASEMELTKRLISLRAELTRARQDPTGVTLHDLEERIAEVEKALSLHGVKSEAWSRLEGLRQLKDFRENEKIITENLGDTVEGVVETLTDLVPDDPLPPQGVDRPAEEGDDGTSLLAHDSSSVPVPEHSPCG